MKKYHVTYTIFIEVEADSELEAFEKASYMDKNDFPEFVIEVEEVR